MPPQDDHIQSTIKPDLPAPTLVSHVEGTKMNAKFLAPLALSAALLALAGCGNTPGSRALSGGAIGAGGGAIIGAVTGIGPGAGALIGGGAGALTGAATNNRQINLGHPLVGN
jgi:hypothetical protein